MEQELAYQFFLGQADEEEKRKLAAWLKESAEHQAWFEREYRLFLAGQAASAPEPVRGRRIRFSGRFLAVAAGVAAMLVVGLAVGIGSKTKPQEAVGVLQAVAPAGDCRELILRDGSTILLNSGAVLEYPETFSSRERRVRLKGEALFDIVHDAKHPFIVETFAYDIKVTGTRFDVVAEENASEFSTSLLEGGVVIQDRKGNIVGQLSPRQCLTLKDRQLIRQRVNEDDFLWTEGIFSAGGLSFGELMHRMSRCYGVTIVMDRPDEPEIHYDYLKLRIADGIESALEILQRRSSFTYTLDKQTNTCHIQ